MKLEHIDLPHLKLSTLNVRKHGDLNLDDLIASIRSLGVIQPLLVRPNCDGYEVVAGQRRLLACQQLEADGADIEPLPCAILESDDDAAAVEASLAENVMRLPMDELDQYRAFSVLIAKGQTAENIAAHFGVSERLVQQRLAIANLYGPILNAYRREEVDASTMRVLTMATKKQQRAWFKRFRNPDDHAPLRANLKAWLFGGAEIPVSSALFPLEECRGSIISDLFGDERFFDNPDRFWELQNQAIADLRQRYLDDGWCDVVILNVGAYFRSYEMVARGKKQGGRVYIACAANGEVACHEGYITEKEVKREDRAKAKANGEPLPAKSELTKAAMRYCDLHRHNAVRVELLAAPQLALRLLAAHLIAQPGLWDVSPENQATGGHEAIETSLKAGRAQKVFDKERQAVRKLLGFKEADGFLMRPSWEPKDVCVVFARLLELKDKDVTRILTFAMAETLQHGTRLVEVLGHLLEVDMADWWEPDETFFDLLRDKTAINAILAEVAGKRTADGNVTATAKVQKAIIRDCLKGSGNRQKVTGWMPRYMRFPMQAYATSGGMNALVDWKPLIKLFRKTS